MKKFLLFALPMLFISCQAKAGTLTIYQDVSGNMGSVTFGTAPQIFADSTTWSGFVQQVGPLTWDMTIGGKANRALVVACGTHANDHVSSITVSGLPMTLSTSAFDTNGEGIGVFIYTMAAPPVGSVGIITYFASGISDRGSCEAYSFSGVDQVTPVDVATATVRSPAGGTQTVTLTTTQKRDAIIDVLSDGNGEVITPGANQTQVLLTTPINSFIVASSSKTAAVPGTYSMTWTDANVPMAQAAIALRPSQ